MSEKTIYIIACIYQTIFWSYTGWVVWLWLEDELTAMYFYPWCVLLGTYAALQNYSIQQACKKKDDE